MKVKDIYIRYNVTPNLQEHMLRVASVGAYICDHFRQKKAEKEEILKTLLLHDLGNLVRFDLANPRFLGGEEKRLKHWQRVQKEMIAKYGTDDHKATDKILAELGVSEKLRKAVTGMLYIKSKEIAEEDNWLIKICLYSDLRVGPEGILSLNARLEDAFTRHPSFKGRKDLYEGIITVEKQIAENLDVPVSEINSANVKIDREKLLNFDFSKEK